MLVLACLILGGKTPDRLCIIFTAKAARAMRGWPLALLGSERTLRWTSTFHAVIARLVIEDGAGVPCLPRGFAILSQVDARALLVQAAGLQATCVTAGAPRFVLCVCDVVACGRALAVEGIDPLLYHSGRPS